MMAGISWIILGCTNLYIYKYKKLPMQKTIALSLLIPGTFMFIVGLINLHYHSEILKDISISSVIPAGLYVLYKTKRWNEAMDVMDKLTKK